jgi:hypothetical protein
MANDAPVLGEVGRVLGRRYPNLGAVSTQFQPSESVDRFLLRDVDPNWENVPSNAFFVELLLQPNLLELLPAWLRLKHPITPTDEVVNTIIDLDDPVLIRLLRQYQTTLFVSGVTIDELIQARIYTGASANPRLFYLATNSTLHQLYGGRSDRNRVISIEYSRGMVTETRVVGFSTKSLRDYLIYRCTVMMRAEDEMIPGPCQLISRANFEYLLASVKPGTEEAWDLVGYAIAMTSPFYYSLCIDKFGVPTLEELAIEAESPLLVSKFSVWASTYQPELLQAFRAIL